MEGLVLTELSLHIDKFPTPEGLEPGTARSAGFAYPTMAPV